MTNPWKLRGRMVEKGYNMSSFSKAANLSRPSLRKKVNGQSEFKASEIEKVCILLDIPCSEIASYFFSPYVPEMGTAKKRTPSNDPAYIENKNNI